MRPSFCELTCPVNAAAEPPALAKSGVRTNTENAMSAIIIATQVFFSIKPPKTQVGDAGNWLEAAALLPLLSTWRQAFCRLPKSRYLNSFNRSLFQK